ncbi:MAG: exodeoxyribonuclease VII large subunit, partial [Spirochaetaceae bacterium]|nr:exodeoxyribonuclease VII large subunit [Spirochaetaceae bacterium]
MTVSQLTDLIKEFLESSFPDLTIEGEISNYRPSSTGHIYFTLKDDKAAISAVMFKTRSKSLTFTPQDGMKVKVTGSLSVYAQRGSYQIIVNSMEELGTGNILQLLEERKKRLAMEGLFDSEN